MSESNNRTVDVAIPPLAQPYTYSAPPSFGAIEIGMRVKVPLGRRMTEGYVVRRSTGPAPKTPILTLKPILQRLDSFACFSLPELEFYQWVADYYGSSLASVIDVAIPPAAPPKLLKEVRLIRAPSAEELSSMRSQIQREVIEALQRNEGKVDQRDLTRQFKNIHGPLRSLQDRNLITVEQREVFDHHQFADPCPDWAKRSVVLTAAQTSALEKIDASFHAKRHENFLLHGVTGSGKTEVYIELVRRVRAENKDALIIVPEIALTPQLLDRFRARLGDEIAVLHSGLHKRSRWDAWRALIEGRSRIAIGARSAIFAPLRELGVVIVDEEHDQSFKQSDGLRYNARDLAIVRGRMASCPVVLGSATPSLESLYQSRSNIEPTDSTSGKTSTRNFHYLSLPAEAGYSSKVSIKLVDLTRNKPWEMKSPNVSGELYSELERIVESGEQAFILYNRRGFSSYLQCESCNEAVCCPNCSVTLTYHQGRHALMCHYCGSSNPPPEVCPACSRRHMQDGQTAAGALTHRGGGTERVFDELLELFPRASIDRLDRDAAHNLERYREILHRVRENQTQILVGTQMLAKGHDLPNVTFVGVVDCDIGLHMPDFRAAERIFQLLAQASGRAGRGTKTGRVLLQTRVPRHTSLRAAVKADYDEFSQYELSSRRELLYPPFSRLLRIIASAEDKDLAMEVLKQLRVIALDVIKREELGISVLGPAEAPLAKLKTRWRSHLLLKSKTARDLLVVRANLQRAKIRTKKVRVVYDIDPQDML